MTGEDNHSRQAQENRLGRALKRPYVGYHAQTAPDIGPLRIFEQKLTAGGRAIYVGAAEPLSQVADARHGVARSFLLAGGLALLLAVISAYLIGGADVARRFASRRRRRRAGGRRRSHTTGETPGRRRDYEHMMLGDAFNHMLDRLEEAFVGQREFVADVSHELRTPLTVIRGQLELLAAQEYCRPWSCSC